MSPPVAMLRVCRVLDLRIGTRGARSDAGSQEFGLLVEALQRAMREQLEQRGGTVVPYGERARQIVDGTCQCRVVHPASRRLVSRTTIPQYWPRGWCISAAPGTA